MKSSRTGRYYVDLFGQFLASLGLLAAIGSFFVSIIIGTWQTVLLSGIAILLAYILLELIEVKGYLRRKEEG